MQISDEIKSRLDVVDVIKEYIQLKAVGSNFSALSPFGHEKTPSFMVSPEKQIWHCFSTGKGGDIITFIMEVEGVSFVEALRILAPKAGVVFKQQNPAITSERNRLLDVMEVASNYYHHILFQSNRADFARKYLKERDLSKETIMDWKIGFSVEAWSDLVDVLKKRGYKDNEIVKAGLANQRKNSNGIYNRFRDRIMFPISDVNGSVVAFSARVRPDKEADEIMGKYINSPQTLIYNKSRIVFGLDKAKIPIRNEDLAVVVEGQMDVITAHQNGFKNVVASSGTALTSDQLKLIKRYTNNIAFSFDMDNAGQIATDRAIKEAMTMDMNIKVIILPNGKDPDDFLKKDPEKWKDLVKNAKHAMDYYFDKVFFSVNIKDIDGKREATKIILPIINRLKNLVEKDFWLKKFSQKIDIEERYLRETLANIDKEKDSFDLRKEEKSGAGVANSTSNEVEQLTDEEKKSEYLLSILIKFPVFLSYASKEIDDNLIFGENNRLLYNNLIVYYNNNESIFNFDDFKKSLGLQDFKNKKNQFNLLYKLVVFGDREFLDTTEIDAKTKILNILILLKRKYLKNIMKTLSNQMSQAESDGNKEKLEQLTLKFIEISKKLHSLKIS